MEKTAQLWDSLAGLPAWQVTEIPRPREDPLAGTGDGGVAQRTAALASAYGCDAPVAVGWVRDRPGGPVQVLAAGPALAGGQDGRRAVLMVPGGARGIPVADGEMVRMLAAVPCWTRICGISDVLRAQATPQAPGGLEVRPSLEDGLLSAWLDAFAWLLLAEPVNEDMLNEMAATAAREQHQAEQEGSPRGKLAAQRAAARHAELREGITAGMWRVHLLAGAGTPADAGRVARLVCASADLRGLPYGLSARRAAGPLPDMLIAENDDGYATGRTRPYEQPAVRQVMNDRSWWDTPIYATQPGWQAEAGPPRQWPDPGNSAAPVSSAVAARQAADERDTPVPQSPFIASTRLVAALARAPATEVPGVRFTLRPQFDVTPETRTAGTGAVVVAGMVLDHNRVPAGPLTLPLESLNRHVFVCGATGAGKSQTVRNLLEQATRARIPWLVIEPAKAEYRLMAARLPDVQVITIRPGDLGTVPAGINPLEPAPGAAGGRFPLQVHADLLRALFLAAFDADEPFPQVLAAALARCYEQAGWDLTDGQPAITGTQPSYPDLEDLQAAALAVVNQAGYGREVRDNVRGFVQVRIGSLRLGTTGRFLDSGHPLNFAALLDRNAVLEIEDAGDDHDKAFLIGAVLIRLTEHLRLRARHEGPGQPRLRHLTVIEEAHRLLRQPPPAASARAAAHAVEMFADLLAEIRTYGEGLIIAEQIPAKLIPDTIKNTAVKIVHRLPAHDDRAAVGATMNLTGHQSEYLVTLPPGEAAVHADGMDYPLLARIPDGTSREISTPARPVSPDAVIGRRSPTCGPDCLDHACTLGQMRAAQRVMTADRRITLWAELTVISHLTGWDMPRPAPSFTAVLRAMDPRTRDCALSHAADAAVAARATAISSRVSPDALAGHITTAMRQVIKDGTPGCADEEPQFLAPPYRWMRVRAALRAAAPTGTGRHPRSDEWEHTYCQAIPGTTAARQLRLIDRWYARDQADTQAVTTVIWGNRPHPAIEQCVGTRAGADLWPARLTEALSAFATLRWVRRMLVRPGAGRRREAAGKRASGE
jgi:hypothetical protein